MTKDFDPYRRWLNIRYSDGSPDHYALLGLPVFEADPRRIKAAFFQRQRLLHRYEVGGHEEHAQRLLHELSAAYRCLSRFEDKEEYDLRLRETIRQRTTIAAEDTQAERPAIAAEPAVVEAEVVEAEVVEAEVVEAEVVARPGIVEVGFAALTAAWNWGRDARYRQRLGVFWTVVGVLALAAAVTTWSRMFRHDSPSQSGVAQGRPGSAASGPSSADPPAYRAEDRPREPPRQSETAPPAVARVQTLRGHADAILAVAFSRDGRRALTGSQDATAIVWDVAEGRAVRTLRGHTAAITSVAISADGAELLTGSEDRSAVWWNAASGEKRGEFRVHLGGVTAVAFHPSGASVVTASTDGLAILSEPHSGQPIRTYRGHSKALTSLAFSPDGRHLLTGSWDRTAILHDVETARILATFRGHEGPVLSVAFHPNGKQVLTGGGDRTARLWDAATGAVLGKFQGYTDRIGSVVFCADGEQVLTAFDGDKAVLWDARTGRKLFTFQDHGEPIASLAPRAGVQRVLIGSADNTATAWEWHVGPAAAPPLEKPTPPRNPTRRGLGSLTPAAPDDDRLLGMEFALIPAGAFLMGSPQIHFEADSDEKPRHLVRITKPFYLGVTEVTQGQYERVMGENPSRFQGDRQRPVERVSWEDAMAFCRRLSELEGQIYRLPTEAEWEYACRAASGQKYGFGDQAGLLVEYAWFVENSGGRPQPVGTKKANPWGLYDMHGNVWEWCADRYASYKSSPGEDPRGPESGSSRVYRGGGWFSGASSCRAAFRSWSSPGYRDDSLGFRLARTASASEAAGSNSQSPP